MHTEHKLRRALALAKRCVHLLDAAYHNHCAAAGIAPASEPQTTKRG